MGAPRKERLIGGMTGSLFTKVATGAKLSAEEESRVAVGLIWNHVESGNVEAAVSVLEDFRGRVVPKK